MNQGQPVTAIAWTEVQFRGKKGELIAIVKTPANMFNVQVDAQPGKPYTIHLEEDFEHAKRRIGPPFFKD